nr:unnamed protein product [Callosobruchus analis]
MYFFKSRTTFTQVLVFSIIVLITLVAILKRQVRNSNQLVNPHLTEEQWRQLLHCQDTFIERSIETHGGYMVFKNFVRANRNFKCYETITLTAPGDYRFLDNVIQLVDRWDGPISIALHAPGFDFFNTLKCIAYLRNCRNQKVKELVSFHLFFEYDHIPFHQNVPLMDAYEDTYNCTELPPYETLKDEDMYKARENLTYPINVARNIAKVAVQTYWVFPIDVELYPTKHFIQKFMDFIIVHPEYIEPKSNNVFVLPIFEILEDQKVPETKADLRKMLEQKTAIIFHQGICTPCHRIPKSKEWMKANMTDSLDVFTVSKRTGSQRFWEPFFVCTQKEPLWDERLNWEGQGNKMCQAYHLCMLDYNFLVMDNAFLIHKPGVKKKKVQIIKHQSELRKNNRILKIISRELKSVYGPNDQCIIHQ